ncbi:peptidase family S51, peptidase [Seminavis robusta]|uniref:Peptidase family S51, peptidase n=1 Tax=Seminavis robusta TaxID=568900 RepID=A0A9N8ELJ9_9STRA|nr:peptidase family S51, peptidase [Seminavis robusta]|eukprot:Sro1168_g248530.1 peptidase family S51, peptidase (371) ;mRNA; r:26641-27753
MKSGRTVVSTTSSRSSPLLSSLPLLFLVRSCSSMTTTPLVPKQLRGVFCGSGSDGMSDPRLADAILGMIIPTQQPKQEQTNVLYLGTATYDLPQFAERQTARFRERHCHVSHLPLVNDVPSVTKLENDIRQAHVIVVGGGNTLFAIDRWKRLGIVPYLLKQAMERGAILTGGSAGAICWFDGGHSDSMDPDTYKTALQAKFSTTAATTVADESSTATDNIKDWKYIRVPGLGFLPGLLCPHHDRRQSNGILRAHDFDRMLLQHPGEIGIGIDHWAALVVDGEDSYRVLSLQDKPGSVLHDNTFSDNAKGLPGIWIKRVVDGTVQSRVCPPKGKLSDILQPASEIVQDTEDMEQCRRDNPDDGPGLQPQED